MRRPVVYLSGPISEGGTAPTWKQREHVHFATEFAFDLIRKQHSVICPHWSFLAEAAVRDHISHAEWIANDLPIIATCDALYRLPGDSAGADAEVLHALTCKIPVFRDVATMTSHFKSAGMLP